MSHQPTAEGAAAPDDASDRTPLGSIGRVASRTRRHETSMLIRRSILNGTLPRGIRLTDAELARTLGVSRPTVREAVQSLVHEGILEYEAYKGISVPAPSDQALLDIAEVRLGIETVAARRVAALLAKDPHGPERRQLDRALVRLREEADAKRAVQLNEAHFAFHRLVHELSGVALLVRIWDVIETQTRLALLVNQATLPGLRRIASDHERMLEVLADSPDQIETLLAEHILHNTARVLERRAEAPATPTRTAPRKRQLQPGADDHAGTSSRRFVDGQP